MFGFAKIKASEDAVGIRFEKVEPENFKLILSRFHQSFPLKEWDPERREWLLPPGDFENVVRFCEKIFGPKGYRVDKANTEQRPSQASFDFN